jgi:hypothetical protein
MGSILRRSLGLVLAMALVVAGLPVSHAMPTVSTLQQHDGHAEAIASSASHLHHCDDMAMDAAPGLDEPDQADHAAPCKCLNCSLCLANFVTPLLRLAMLERRTIPVIYRIHATHMAGVGIPIDPGIPILAG